MIERASSPASPLRVLFTLGAAGTMSDGELLRRYLDGRPDEAECAFAVLVDRHGPMVRHVCLATLGDPHDAADAFQAAFLVLARRAGSIRGDSVGPWLFGVSRRVALRARAASARRRKAERIKAEQSAPHLAAEPSSPDDWSALYKELDRLPARYRDPLVLCHLQGLTHDQAASRLGIPTPTLRTRLTRGRDRLRARLLRRGLAPSSASALLLAPVSLTPSPAASLASIGWASAAARLAVSSRGVPLASLATSVPLAAATLRSLTMLALSRSLALGTVAFLGVSLGAAGYAVWGRSGDAAPTSVPPALARQDPVPPGPDRVEFTKGQVPPTLSNTPWEIASERVHAEVDAEVETPLWIRSILPDGSVVSRDQVICELDTTRMRARLESQQIATERAQTDYSIAIKDREIAELTVRHYLEGAFPLEEIEALGEVKLAMSEKELAKARLSHVERNAPENERALRTLEAKVELQRAELALTRAEKALEVLREYTLETRIKALEGAVEKARAEELARQSAFEQEKEREERLRRSIKNSQIKAPADGILSLPVGIREGVPIQDGQLLFQILPPPDDENAPTEPERRPSEIDPPDRSETEAPR